MCLFLAETKEKNTRENTKRVRRASFFFVFYQLQLFFPCRLPKSLREELIILFFGSFHALCRLCWTLFFFVLFFVFIWEEKRNLHLLFPSVFGNPSRLVCKYIVASSTFTSFSQSVSASLFFFSYLFCFYFHQNRKRSVLPSFCCVFSLLHVLLLWNTCVPARALSSLSLAFLLLTLNPSEITGKETRTQTNLARAIRFIISFLCLFAAFAYKRKKELFLVRTTSVWCVLTWLRRLLF